MPAAAIVTLVIATLIIAAAALGLIRVIGHLMATLRTLRALTGGVDVVAEKTSTVPAVVRSSRQAFFWTSAAGTSTRD